MTALVSCARRLTTLHITHRESLLHLLQPFIEACSSLSHLITNPECSSLLHHLPLPLDSWEIEDMSSEGSHEQLLAIFDSNCVALSQLRELRLPLCDCSGKEMEEMLADCRRRGVSVVDSGLSKKRGDDSECSVEVVASSADASFDRESVRSGCVNLGPSSTYAE